MPNTEFSQTLLAWYDRHAREMPWRVGPTDRAAGICPDPYRVWLSEVMLQQTTVVTVRDYFQRFTKLWPTVEALATADDGDVMGEWAGLGYYARARNLMKCARVVAGDMDGRFPESVEELVKLPGIGPYTAAAVASIAFDRKATVVDGNVERVMARYFRVLTPLPTAKPELTALAERLTPISRAGDYAQAVMDLGATVCTPRTPACGVCPCQERCVGRLEGVQDTLPRKLPKPVKPTRYGIVYLARREDGAWLLERRENKGLLGGMLGWPGAEWGEEAVEDAPISAEWADPEAEVRHTFTHFHLRLGLRVAIVGSGAVVRVGSFVEPDDFRPSDLPTVMRKAYDMASVYFSES